MSTRFSHIFWFLPSGKAAARRRPTAANHHENHVAPKKANELRDLSLATYRSEKLEKPLSQRRRSTVKRNTRHFLSFAARTIFTAAMAGALLASFMAFCQADVGQSKPLDLVTAVTQVAKQNIPAVVHIEVTERKEVDNPLLPFEKDPLFRRYFNLPKKLPKKFKQEVVGLGSGVIIDTQGHILTNNHLVAGASKIEVVMANGHSYSGNTVSLVGTDAKTDLAVIQILVSEALPHTTFGDSDKVEVGQWVVAIGHPRGLDQTVTHGIISAKHRRGITDPSSYQDFLQTDAAINPGNSGGPLLNLYGDVIGINTAIASESGGSEGIGFAIPSNMAVHVSQELLARGKVERGWVGVTMQDLTPELVRKLGVNNTRGVLVAGVFRDSPADRAGLKKGDVVVAYQDKEMPDSGTFRNEVSTALIGQEVKISVLREGKKQHFLVQIGSQEEQKKILSASLRERFGLTVRPLTAKEKDKYGLETDQGVAVQEVAPKSVFSKMGFRTGDLILQVNDDWVDDPEDLAGLLAAQPSGEKANILAIDHKSGKSGYLTLTLP
jgi:serine protease Do